MVFAIRVTAHKDDAHFWIHGVDGAVKFNARHLGHGDVGDHKGEIGGVFLEDAKAFFAINGDVDVFAEFLEAGFDDFAHQRIVFDQQNLAAGFTDGRFLGRRGAWRRSGAAFDPFGDGQPNGNGRAVIFGAFEFDLPAVELGNAVDNCQAEAGGMAAHPRGEERFERAFAGGLVHAETGVANSEFDGVAGENVEGRALLVGNGFARQGDLKCAAGGKSEAGVAEKVRERVLPLSFIGEKFDRSQRALELDLRAGSEVFLQLLDRVLNDAGEINIMRVKAALRTHAKEDVVEETFRFTRGGFHGGGVLRGGGSFGDFFADERNVAEKRDQEVVEIVGEFADDRFQGFEALVAVTQSRIGGVRRRRAVGHRKNSAHSRRTICN